MKEICSRNECQCFYNLRQFYFAIAIVLCILYWRHLDLFFDCLQNLTKECYLLEVRKFKIAAVTGSAGFGETLNWNTLAVNRGPMQNIPVTAFRNAPVNGTVFLSLVSAAFFLLFQYLFVNAICTIRHGS